MAEYIERDKTIEWARLTYCKDCNSYNGIMCRACQFDDTITLIEEYPAADVVEVVHGEWECPCFDISDYWRCSACGEEWFFEYDPTEAETKVNYCPNCGAKMDGERRSNNEST